MNLPNPLFANLTLTYYSLYVFTLDLMSIIFYYSRTLLRSPNRRDLLLWISGLSDGERCSLRGVYFVYEQEQQVDNFYYVDISILCVSYT